MEAQTIKDLAIARAEDGVSSEGSQSTVNNTLA
jgi:hypothetical protein